jgi:hypothetical protein
MAMTVADVAAVFPGIEPAARAAVLGAMRRVAETGSPASAADREAVEACAVYMFGAAPPAWDGLAPVEPPALAAALAGTGFAEDALKFLVVMALVDGVLDGRKIEAAASYADALGLHPRFLEEVVTAAEGRIKEALADMTRANMESITGKPFAGDDQTAWILVYDRTPDPKLAARFHALATLPAETFGNAFFRHFTENGYAFPGEPHALNAAFSVPHDSLHVLTGYDTKPRGELLVSTFTAAAHRVLPMAGHILPVIMSWHLRLKINSVAGAAGGALEPREFWRAWAAGAAARIDAFAPGWNFWALTGRPLAEVRRSFAIPEAGLAA